MPMIHSSLPCTGTAARDRQRSTLSAAEQQAVMEHYDLGSVFRWQRNTRGLVNESFELDGRYFLTIYRRKTHDQIGAVAQVAHEISDAIPIARPLPGATGYVMQVRECPALLTTRLPGTHYVGTAHTQKTPMPRELHRSMARFFWKLQKRLSDVSEQLKTKLRSISVMKIGDLPDSLPSSATPLIRHVPEGGLPAFTYPDLIHDDMERQNILSEGSNITGIVDLDSIRTGDILHEYAHFLFNVALCDPHADASTIDMYLNEMVKAGIIRTEDIPSLHAHIFRFAVSDVVDFAGLIEHPQMEQHSMIDLPLLVQQYDRALSLSAEFFRKEFSL